MATAATTTSSTTGSSTPESAEYAFKADASHETVSIMPSPSAWLDGHSQAVLRGLVPPSDLTTATGEGSRIVMLDSGIQWSLSVFRGAKIDGRDFTGSGCLSDPTGHGTRNASVLVGQGNGMVVGLASRSELSVGKVLGQAGRARTERAVVAGINWALAQRPDLLVLAFGSRRGSRPIREALDRVVQAGCHVLAAAGNRPGIEVAFPARLPQVRAVSVLGENGAPDARYCTAAGIDVFAPGRGIPAAGPDGPTTLSGSSIATVVLAGLYARHGVPPGANGDVTTQSSDST